MSKIPIAALEDHIGYWLRFVSNGVSQGFSAKLIDRDVTVAEWVVLRTLYDEAELTPGAVATRLGMTRGAISKLVDRLEGKELLTRAFSTIDRRSQSLTLSPKGQALVPQLAELANQNDAEFFRDLSMDDRAAIIRIMKELVARRGLKAVPTE